MSTASPASVDLAQRLNDLLDHIRQGRILEAMEEFYADDAVMEEPAYGRTEGLPANIEREKAFLASVREWKGFDVAAIGVGENVTFYEHTMDWVDVDGENVHVEQIARAIWKDGKIVHERFYYDNAGKG